MLTFLLGTGYTVGCGAVGALLARLNLLVWSLTSLSFFSSLERISVVSC